MAIIKATGSYIPELVVPNSDFYERTFYDKNGKKIEKSGEEIAKKLEEITGIHERRYAHDDQVTSDLAYEAAVDALKDYNKEELEMIIVAHNFGDNGTMVPSLASKVKNKLGIKNPNCNAYDIVAGCPGWVEGLIQAFYAIGSNKSNALVIGAEKMSAVLDLHDKDSMIFSDGAGAVIVELNPTYDKGIISVISRTYSDEAYLISHRKSTNPSLKGNYIKMDGRDVFKFAKQKVPDVVKESIDNIGFHIDDIDKILIHQANEKMLDSIAKGLYKLYEQKVPDNIMPITISKLGNSSVATIPTMLDLILKGKLDNHTINSGDIIILASVGAGMNINSVVYRHI